MHPPEQNTEGTPQPAAAANHESDPGHIRRRRSADIQPVRARGASAVGAMSVGAIAIGAAAIGALSVGALAIGALAIGKLAIKKGRIRELTIDELKVGRLWIDGQEVRPPADTQPTG